MAEQGTHFYFMSMQMSNARGFYTTDFQGVLTPKPGQTRLDLFNEIRADFEAREPRVRSGVVIAFDIQPNKL